MNWNVRMAGSAGTDPLLFMVAASLILARKMAGHFGAAYFLRRWIGTPWRKFPTESADPAVRPV